MQLLASRQSIELKEFVEPETDGIAVVVHDVPPFEVLAKEGLEPATKQSFAVVHLIEARDDCPVAVRVVIVGVPALAFVIFLKAAVLELLET